MPADDTKPAAPAAKDHGLTLDQLLNNLNSEGFSKTLDNLVGVLNEQGKSKEEIQQTLADLRKRDEARLAQMEKLQQAVTAREGDLKKRADEEAKQKIALSKIDIEIATLKGRLAEQQKVGRDIDASMAARQKKIDELDALLANMNKGGN